jgi:DNA polymerase-3 subunit alpha
MLEALPAAMGQAARRRSDEAAGQESLFGAGIANGAAPFEVDPLVSVEEMSREELLGGEKEALGLFVSSHPLQECRRQLARATTCGLGSLAERADGEAVTVGGLVGMLKPVTTRRGEPMMFLRLDDLEGSAEVVVVPAVCAEVRELLVQDAILIVAGRVDQKSEGETKLVAQRITAFQPDPDGEEERLLLQVDAAALGPRHLGELKRLIADHRGQAPVVLLMGTAEGPVRLRFGDEFRVNPRDHGLVASLKSLFGERCLV